MLTSFTAAMLAAAQPAPLPGFQQEPLILDQNRADRIQPVTPSIPPSEAIKPSTESLAHVGTAGANVPINHIAFEGTEIPEVVADAARAFIGKPATRDTLQQLAKAMSDAYAKSDVALYTISIPDQILTDGDVQVRVAEGFIEKVVYPDEANGLIRAYGAQLMAHKPLTKRALERYLSLMRDIAGTKIDAQLVRGQAAGGVVLMLSVSRKRRDVAFGFNNSGSALLGREQLRGEVSAYGLFRDGDRTDINGLASVDFKRVKNIGLAHSTPIGADGMRLSLSAGYLQTQPKQFPIKGEAKTAGISLSYPIIRGYRRNLTVSASVDGLNSDAAVFGAMASSDRTRAARVALGYSNVSEKRVISAGFTASQGIDMLGARSLGGISDLGFAKVNGRVTLDQQVNKRAVLRTRAAGQYSRDRLAASERFAIGGADFGRAFDGAILSGDRGFGGLAELAYRPKLPKSLGSSEVYSFIDYGKIWIEPRFGGQTVDYDLASVGGGVRIAYKKNAWLELEAARSIDKPYAAFQDKWRFNLGWRISLGKKD
jgi:hemolysin activation/secretion protein